MCTVTKVAEAIKVTKDSLANGFTFSVQIPLWLINRLSTIKLFK